MDIGEQLKRLRLAHKYSQADLALALHVSRQAVSRWENNNVYPSVTTLMDLADLYGLSLSELLKENDYQLVDHLDHAVKWERLSKWGLRIVLVLVVIGGMGASVFTYGRAHQIDVLNRVNPFLSTQISYARVPAKVPTKKEIVLSQNGKHTSQRQVPQPVDVWVPEDRFGGGEWIKVAIGIIPTKTDRYLVLEHKGSYVHQARLIKAESVPKTILPLLGERYHAYNPAFDGPRVH